MVSFCPSTCLASLWWLIQHGGWGRYKRLFYQWSSWHLSITSIHNLHNLPGFSPTGMGEIREQREKIDAWGREVREQRKAIGTQQLLSAGLGVYYRCVPTFLCGLQGTVATMPSPTICYWCINLPTGWAAPAEACKQIWDQDWCDGCCCHKRSNVSSNRKGYYFLEFPALSTSRQ